MADLPLEVQRRLDRLSKEFRSKLPSRLQEIQTYHQKAVEEGEEPLRELRTMVHRIAGSAATFGLERLNALARELEALVERDLSGQVQTPSEATGKAVLALVNSWSPTEQTETSESNQGTSDSEMPCRRAVFLPEHTVELPTNLAEQLAVFGIAVNQVDAISEVRNYIAEDGAVDGCHYVMVLVDIDHIRRSKEELQELGKLKRDFHGRVFVIALAAEADFETRLRSVRYGADAFISGGLISTNLVETIEQLIPDQPEEPYHVLIVDDDPDQVATTAFVLQQAGMITSVVSDPENIFQVLSEYKPELILMDMYLPGCTGAELAALIRQNEQYVSVPIVFLSVETNTEKQLEAIASGADDFLTKPINPRHLATSVRIRAARTRSMRFFMERDSLTGLLNHTNLKTRLETELQRARRMGNELAFAMIDLDRFKSVNDRYGHLTGDQVLRSLSRLLEERLRRTDIVGRYGGEEFGIVLFNTTSDRARRLMDEIRESFSKIRHYAGSEYIQVTLSCGIADYPSFETAGAVSEAADAALYQAKENGRNQVVVAGQ